MTRTFWMQRSGPVDRRRPSRARTCTGRGMQPGSGSRIIQSPWCTPHGLIFDSSRHQVTHSCTAPGDHALTSTDRVFGMYACCAADVASEDIPVGPAALCSVDRSDATAKAGATNRCSLVVVPGRSAVGWLRVVSTDRGSTRARSVRQPCRAATGVRRPAPERRLRLEADRTETCARTAPRTTPDGRRLTFHVKQRPPPRRQNHQTAFHVKPRSQHGRRGHGPNLFARRTRVYGRQAGRVTFHVKPRPPATRLRRLRRTSDPLRQGKCSTPLRRPAPFRLPASRLVRPVMTPRP